MAKEPVLGIPFSVIGNRQKLRGNAFKLRNARNRAKRREVKWLEKSGVME